MIASFITAKNHCLCFLTTTTSESQIIFIILPMGQIIIASSTSTRFRDCCSCTYLEYQWWFCCGNIYEASKG